MTRELTMVEAIREAMTQEMAIDERVVLLGEDVGRMGGVFRATSGLRERYGASRVFDTPLAESGIVGGAIGLAISGLVPIAEVQFLGFAQQAFHQVAGQLSRVRYRSGGRFGAQVTIRSPYGGLVGAPEHHSDAIEAQFAQIPGLKIVAPSTAHDAKGLLVSAIRDVDPVLFLEPLRGYRRVRDEVPQELYETPLGTCRLVRDGIDLTLISWSSGVSICADAAQILAHEGVSVKVVDLRSLAPLDVDGLVPTIVETGRAVVVQEGPLSCGVASELCATIQEESFYDLQAPILRVSAPDTPYPPVAVEHIYVPGVSNVVAAARRVLEAP